MYTIDLLNQITAKLGGTTVHKFDIDAYNEWCTLEGGTGGHTYSIRALNELSVIYGGSGGYVYSIEALNNIDTLNGGPGGHIIITSALTSIETVLNQTPVVSDVRVSALTETSFTVTCQIDPKGTLTPVLHYGLTTEVTETLNGSEISEADTVTFEVTSVTDANYFFKVVAGETESAQYSTIPADLRDGSVVSWVKLASQSGNFLIPGNSNTYLIFDDLQDKALSANLMGAWTAGSPWVDNGDGTFTFNSAVADGNISQPAGQITRGSVYAFEYELTTVNASGTLYTNFGAATSSLVRTVGTHTATLIHNGAADTFTVRCNRSAAGSFTIRPISIKRVLGNHFYQTNGNYAPQYNAGAQYQWTGTANDYTLSFAGSGLSVYIVAKKAASDLDFKVYSDLTGIGELSGGVLTLGANAALSAYYGVTIKYVIIRNTATFSQSIVDYLELLNNTKPQPRLILPQTIYAVEGYERALYADQICFGTDDDNDSPEEYTVQFTGDKGSTTGRKFAYTPEVGDFGEYNLTVLALNKTTSALVQSKSTVISVIPADPPSSEKTIVKIGDSLTAPSIITEKLRDRFVAIGGTVPTFAGSYGTDPNKHVGYSGNDIGNFMSSAGRLWKFVVSGVTTPPSRYANYTNNGSTFQIMEISLSGGAGYLKASRTAGTNDPDASGTLTRTTGTGDATITYSSGFDAPASPFFTDAGVFSITEFKANIQVSKIDLFSIQLGANSSNTSEMSDVARTVWITLVKQLIDALIADDEDTKIIVNITSQDSNNPDGWGTTFPDNYLSKQNFRRNLRRLWEMIIAEFDTTTYHENVYVGVAGLGLDRGNPPFTVDQFHPNADGSDAMALSQFPLMLKLLQ